MLAPVSRKPQSASPRPAPGGNGHGPAARPAKPLVEMDQEFLQRLLGPLKILRRYCRVTVEGLDHVPAGGCLLAANHTGWLGLDYSNLAIVLHDSLGRLVHGVVHPLWFSSAPTASFARRVGFVPAEKEHIIRLLRDDKLVVVFPEAERGAFKPTVAEQYKLQEFRRGFVRAAIMARAPILPVAILGGEEANPVTRTIDWTDRFLGLTLPVPKNLIPYPVKWRISFLPPIPTTTYRPSDVDDPKIVHALTRRVRVRIQRELRRQLRERGNRYV